MLIEAKQRIPPYLQALEDPTDGLYGYKKLGQGQSSSAGAAVKEGCTVCGGLGHRIADCPKFLLQKNKQLGQARMSDIGGGGF